LYKKQEHDKYIKQYFKKETIASYALVSNNLTEEVEKNNHFFLFSQFGQSFTGHKYYNKIRQSDKLFSKACTISDEAYGILTIERCWDRWTEIASTTTTDDKEIVSAEFTSANTNKKYKGWSIEGVKRYSEIAFLVEEARELDLRKEIENKYMQHMKGNNMQNNMNENNTPVSTDKITPTIAYNNLPPRKDYNHNDDNNNYNDIDHNENLHIPFNYDDHTLPLDYSLKNKYTTNGKFNFIVSFISVFICSL